MSRKVPASPRKMDLRVRRTRDVLGDALVELMHEKPFAAITVQHVIERAEVGRSTFYTHYRDKDDLFLSDVEDFWEAMSTLVSRRGEPSTRVAPVRELFAHVSEAHEFYAALVASGKIHDVLELGQGHFLPGRSSSGWPSCRGRVESPRSRAPPLRKRSPEPYCHLCRGG
jgi:AcrR family transcriptional regulator